MYITVTTLSDEEQKLITSTTTKLRFNMNGLNKKVKSISIIPKTHKQFHNIVKHLGKERILRSSL